MLECWNCNCLWKYADDADCFGKVDEAESRKKEEEYRNEAMLAHTMWQKWQEGDLEELAAFSEQFHGAYPRNDYQVQILLFLINVYKKEKEHSEVFLICEWEKLFRYFKHLCFVLRRLSVDTADRRFADIFQKWLDQKISTELLEAVADTLALDFKIVYTQLIKLSYTGVKQHVHSHSKSEI